MSQVRSNDSFLTSVESRLFFEGIDTTALAREYGTPLFVVSEPRLVQNIERLKRIGDVIPFDLKICYAAKAMSVIGVLRAVSETGIDIEVNSGGELWKALKAGFRGSQIIFNGTSKEVWELELAITNEIYAIQADSLFELSLIDETATRLGKRANVSLRMVPEIESSTLSGLQTALLTSKFGMMPDEAMSAIEKYRGSDHLAIGGIHLHIGSQNPDPRVYTEALTTLFRFIGNAAKTHGVKLSHANIGGGFPVDYLKEGSQQYIDEDQAEMLHSHFEPADAMRAAWESVKTDDSALSDDILAGLTLLIEPGRSVIADTTICLTTVRNVKERPIVNSDLSDKVSETDHWLLTDAGFNLLLSMETYKWYYHLISATRCNEAHDHKYKVAGPLCDGGDVYFDIEGNDRLPEHRLLPADVRPGEVLALLNCGAYSLSQASQYNGRPLPPVVLIQKDGSAKLIRRRDDLDDLVNNDIF